MKNNNKSKENKESFIDNISVMTHEKLNELIKLKGKGPKLVQPIIYLNNYNKENIIKHAQEFSEEKFLINFSNYIKEIYEKEKVSSMA